MLKGCDKVSIYYNLSLRKKSKKRKNFNLEGSFEPLYEILNKILQNLRVSKRKKTKAPVKILELLNEIIPNEYFGKLKNRRRFYRVVNLILTQSRFECVYTSIFYKGYDLDIIPWLKSIRDDNTIKGKILKNANLFLMDYVVKPLIKFFYVAIKSFQSYEIRLIRKEAWISYKTKVFHNLLKNNYVEEVTASEKIQARGDLQLIPKRSLNELNFRPVFEPFKNPTKKFLKRILVALYKVLENANCDRSLYKKWAAFVEKHGDEKIYAVKVDIKDAFGNISIPCLLKMISSIPQKFLPDEHKKFLEGHVKNQFIMFRKKLYRWNHGLLQGDVLSAPLCELYMDYVDKNFQVGKNCFFYRTVDDYFFCSTEKDAIRTFISYMSSSHPINPKKTISNINDDSCVEIPYCGKVFNLKTKEIKSFFNLNVNCDLRHRFRFWNIKNPIPENKSATFIRKMMQFSTNSNFFSCYELNTVFNTQRTVLENVFDGMVFVAFRFDAVITTLVIDNLIDFGNCQIYNVLDKIVTRHVVKIDKIMRKHTGEFCYKKIPMKQLKVIAFKAFVVVLKRKYETYKNLIECIDASYKFIHLDGYDLDFKYFHKLPSTFKNVKLGKRKSDI